MPNHALYLSLHNGCSQYCPVYSGGHTQVLLLVIHEPPFAQRQARLERKKRTVIEEYITCKVYITSTLHRTHYMPHTSDAATDMHSSHCYAFHSLGHSIEEGRHIMSLLASLYMCCWITCVLTSTVPPQAYRKYTHWSSGTSLESFVTLSRLNTTMVAPFSWYAKAEVISRDSSTVGIDR